MTSQSGIILGDAAKQVSMEARGNRIPDDAFEDLTRNER